MSDQHEESREAPEDLGAAGRAAWDRYMVCHDDGVPVVKYDIAETMTIEEICRTYDRLAMLRSLIAEAEREGALVSHDVRGAPVLHPAVGQEKMTLALLVTLQKRIVMPPLEVDSPSAAQDARDQLKAFRDHQSRAGQARWKPKVQKAREA